MAGIISGLIILCVISLFVWAEFFSKKAGIPPVPTLPWVKREMIDMLAAHMQADDACNIAELGAGWGGLSQAISEKFPQARVTGFEIFPPAIYCARLFNRNKNINFRNDSFYETDLSSFDVIVCYLSHAHMAQLKEKFERELKSGALILSNAFPVPHWQPLATAYSQFGIKIPVYLYRKS